MNTPNIRVLGYRVLVKQDKVVAEGIVVPDGVQAPKTEGVVCALGDGRQAQSGTVLEMPVKIGDRVWVTPYGQPREIDGENYMLVSVDEILAILPEASRIIKA